MANLIILLRGHTRTHLARLVSERKEKTPALHANITAVRQGLLILACSPHFHLKQMLLFFFCHCITPVVWRRCLLVDLLCKEDYMGANFTLQNLLNVWSVECWMDSILSVYYQVYLIRSWTAWRNNILYPIKKQWTICLWCRGHRQPPTGLQLPSDPLCTLIYQINYNTCDALKQLKAATLPSPALELWLTQWVPK